MVIQSLPTVAPTPLGTQPMLLAVSPDETPACVQEPGEEGVPPAAARRPASAPRKRVAIEVCGPASTLTGLLNPTHSFVACKPSRATLIWDVRAAVGMRLCHMNVSLRPLVMLVGRQIDRHTDMR